MGESKLGNAKNKKAKNQQFNKYSKMTSPKLGNYQPGTGIKRREK